MKCFFSSLCGIQLIRTFAILTMWDTARQDHVCIRPYNGRARFQILEHTELLTKGQCLPCEKNHGRTKFYTRYGRHLTASTGPSETKMCSCDFPSEDTRSRRNFVTWTSFNYHFMSISVSLQVGRNRTTLPVVFTFRYHAESRLLITP